MPQNKPIRGRLGWTQRCRSIAYTSAVLNNLLYYIYAHHFVIYIVQVGILPINEEEDGSTGFPSPDITQFSDIENLNAESDNEQVSQDDE